MIKLTSLFILIITATIFSEMRIVSLGPSVTRTLTSLGIEDYIVGNSKYCDLPKETKSTTIGNLFEINTEKILELNPTIIFAVGLTPQKTINKLEQFGFRVITIDDPGSFSQLCDNMATIAKACNMVEKGDSLIEVSKDKIENIKSKYSSKNRPKIMVQLTANPIYVVLNNTLGGEMISILGGVNPFSDLKNGRTNREVIIDRDPDVIILTNMSGTAGREIIEWNKFKIITAVKNRKVFQFSSAVISSPSVDVFANGLEELGNLIYGK